MNKTTKRSIIISAILSIMLCVSLVAGATFALFTSESEANIVVSSGKVNVTASVTDVQTKQLGVAYAVGKDNMFAGAGAVAIDNGTITINNMVVGDGVKFTIKVANESSVTVKYRTIISCEDEGLFEALDVSIGGTTYNGTTKISNYQELTTSDTIGDVGVEIVFPDNEDANDYQNKTCTISYKVEAVQGNADVEDPDEDTVYINNANDLMALLSKSNIGGTGIKKVEFINDIDMAGKAWTGLRTTNFASHYVIKIIGNDKSIKNLCAPLVISTTYSVAISDLTIQDSNIAYLGGSGYGAFVQYADDCSISLTNCHAKSVTLETEADTRVGTLVGWNSRGSVNGSGVLTIKNCTVEDCSLKAKGTAGGFVGHNGALTTIEKSSVKNTTIYSIDGGNYRVGEYIGTVDGTGYGADEIAKITNCTASDNNVSQINKDNSNFSEFGRLVNNASLDVDGTVYVSGAKQFAKIFRADANINVVLTNNIVADITTFSETITGGSGTYKMGGENTEKINIDLNGYKLTLNTTYWSVLGTKNNAAVVTIKNGSMTSSQTSGTWNSYDLTFYDCTWNFENVTFDKAVAIATGATVSMKEVTINETDTNHDYYALWITADAKKVDLNKVDINSSGRAIAIKDEYVAKGNRNQVELNITNCTFKSAKKAAVLVTNTAGAKITATNYDITQVVADKVNLVHIDNGPNKQDKDSTNYRDFKDNVIFNGSKYDFVEP